MRRRSIIAITVLTWGAMAAAGLDGFEAAYDKSWGAATALFIHWYLSRGSKEGQS